MGAAVAQQINPKAKFRQRRSTDYRARSVGHRRQKPEPGLRLRLADFGKNAGVEQPRHQKATSRTGISRRMRGGSLISTSHGRGRLFLENIESLFKQLSGIMGMPGLDMSVHALHQPRVMDFKVHCLAPL